MTGKFERKEVRVGENLDDWKFASRRKFKPRKVCAKNNSSVEKLYSEKSLLRKIWASRKVCVEEKS